MDYKHIIEKLEHKISKLPKTGKVANYIPELQKINPDKFGFHLACLDGKEYGFGDHNELFSIQSISKVYTLALAKEIIGNDLWKRVHVEPSGNAYNSLTQLENEQGIPRNPFINAGSIVIADCLLSVLDNPKDDLLEFVRKLSHDQSIDYDEKVAESEKATGSRNVALIYYMKSLGNIKNNPDKVLDFYYYQCALSMSCKQLANSFKLFANHGKLTETNEHVFNKQSVKRINSIMLTCGFYDEAGEFSYRVGLPGKSGVGGGIVALLPENYAISVWSPRLNQKGNSSLGMKALEEFTSLTELSIF